MNRKGKGILALAGLAAGAYAFWKYQKMTPEDKQDLKNKINKKGENLKNKVDSFKSSIAKTSRKAKDKSEEALETLTD